MTAASSAGTAQALTVPKNMRVLRAISRLNVFLYKLSGGRIMGSMGGTPVCLVEMRGHKSGRRLTIPLMYNPVGDDVILVASLGGAPRNPHWFASVIANPEIVIQVGSTRRRMRPRQASPEEKSALWPKLVENFPSFGAYQQKTTRDIPVIICSPV